MPSTTYIEYYHNRSLLLKNRIEPQPQVAERTEFVATFEEVTTNAKPLMRELNKIPKTVQSILEKIPHQEVLYLEFLCSINHARMFGLCFSIVSH